MDSELDAFFDEALRLAKEAGKLINERVGKRQTIEAKSCDIDLVTETDQDVEKLLIQGLTKAFPNHKFIGEETASSGVPSELTAAPTWIIDPIDGTLNFVHAFPHSCISIGLFVNKEPVMGIIYNPMLDQLFTAKKGWGAYLNGKSIRVSQEKCINKSMIMMENGTSRDPERTETLFANQQNLIPKVQGIRSLGSAALNMAMVALGGADAYFEYGIHIWDIAAGEILVKEAGGVVIDPAGGEVDRCSRRVLCASSEELAQEISKNLKQYYPTPRD